MVYAVRFSLQNAFCFIILTYMVPVLFTFFMQGVLKLKKIIPAPKFNECSAFKLVEYNTEQPVGFRLYGDKN